MLCLFRAADCQWCARWYKHQQAIQGNGGNARDVDFFRQLKIKLSINVNIPVIIKVLFIPQLMH